MKTKFHKKIKKISYLFLIIMIISFFASNIIFANHNPLHVGQCVPPQVEVPNGTCADPSIDPIFGNQDPDNPCINCVTPPNSGQPSDSNTVYEYLAPLSPNDPTFNTAKPCAFGEYLNVIIDVFIGVSAVLAMLMIVIGGIEYMTSELVSSKESGKSKITQAILGLLLALAAWLILNEINPNLLKLCLEDLPEATPQLQDERENYVEGPIGAGTVPPAGFKNAICKDGIEEAVGNYGSFWVCESVVNSLTAMLIEAGNNQEMINGVLTPKPIKLSGSGWRSREQQIALRIKNCQGDISTKPSEYCTPPTAKPGTSRHESGLAIDLACDGERIANDENHCFKWLAENAKRYKFKNYAREPWHWSTDGN